MTREQLIEAVDNRIREINSVLTNLSDDTAVDFTILFEQWQPNKEYIVGQRVRDEDKLYKVIQTHTSQEDWRPMNVPALFTEIAKPGEITEWKQPTGSQDAYNKGDKVRHNDKIWVSDVDNNVWEPGVYGWTSD